MLHDKEPKYCYNDIMIQPTVLSKVSSRSECNLPDTLPLFTAPMDNVVGLESFEKYEEEGIIPILPRPVPLEKRLNNSRGWSAYGLKEFEENFCDPSKNLINRYALIDVANGHMSIIYDLVRKAKSIWGDVLVVMVGNIANPETYREAEKSGVDYIRVGIGAGRGCITSTCVSTHYPMASLVSETYEIKKEILGKCKIVADGGIRGYGDIIKALALGADYVMVGSVFAQMLEAEGDVDLVGYNTRISKSDIAYQGEGRFEYKGYPVEVRKTFYGMASGRGQKSIGGCHTKTSEGCVRTLEVKYTIKSWIENMRSYLKSAMSYVGVIDLKQFAIHANCIIISQATQDSINK